VARILVNKLRLEKDTAVWRLLSGLELWKRLELDRFFEQAVDDDFADVPWSRVASPLPINRLCAPGSELAIEQRRRSGTCPTAQPNSSTSGGQRLSPCLN
jgi:hypothetical protein